MKTFNVDIEATGLHEDIGYSEHHEIQAEDTQDFFIGVNRALESFLEDSGASMELPGAKLITIKIS